MRYGQNARLKGQAQGAGSDLGGKGAGRVSFRDQHLEKGRPVSDSDEVPEIPEEGSKLERAREYLRQVLAFKGITPLTWGLVALVAGILSYLALPVASSPNYWTYVLIAFLFTRELSSSQMKNWAGRKGWMPQAYPPPSECCSYVNTHAKVARILELGFWILFVGSFLVHHFFEPKTSVTLQFYLMLSGILFLMAGYWWDFSMSGLWEELLLFGSLGVAGFIWQFTSAPIALGMLVFGGGFVVAGVLLLLRWWKWTRSLA